MSLKTIAVMSPGNMGSGVAAALGASGYDIITCLKGRSDYSRDKAARANMRDVGSLDGLVAEADLILSILNPAKAVSLAEEIAAAGGDGFMPQIGTLSGNPVAAVAGLATLEILRQPGTYERLFATGQQLKDALQRLLNEAELPAVVLGEAPLFDAFFTDGEVTDYRSSLSADKEMLGRFNGLLLESGIFKGQSKFYVSTAHTQEDVDQTVEAFASAIDELSG